MEQHGVRSQQHTGLQRVQLLLRAEYTVSVIKKQEKANNSKYKPVFCFPQWRISSTLPVPADADRASDAAV